MLLLICALAFISDRLNQKDPSFDPIIDFKKASSGDAYYIVWKNDGIKSLTGEAKKDILDVIESFTDKIVSPSPETNLFTKSSPGVTILDICASSKKQVFEYSGEPTVLKDSFNKAYETVQDYKKQYLNLHNKSGVTNEVLSQIDKREQLINEIIIVIGELAQELEDKFKSDELLTGVPNIQ